jgi:hypothetical protein
MLDVFVGEDEQVLMGAVHEARMFNLSLGVMNTLWIR